MTWMKQIKNDCMIQHEAQIREVMKTIPKHNGRDVQILPFEAPEVIGYLGILVTVLAIVAAL
jgi:hypothetical protein